MRKSFALLLITLALLIGAAVAAGEEFGRGERRDLLKIETTDLPQGKAVISGGERLIPPGGRSPWHTGGGPKLLYVLEGTMALEGLAGQTLMTCGPAPKLCLSPHKSHFSFRNAGPGPLKFVVIGVDDVERPTTHEMIGQVTGISGDRVTLAVGDGAPRREVTITIGRPGPIAVGDSVITVRHDEKKHTAESLVKLPRR